MVSSDKFRLLSSLREGHVDRLEPEIDDSGRVTYQEVGEILIDDEEDHVQRLNMLSEMDLLEREYTTKTYVCPSCKTEGMQYITACPHCGATHSETATYFQHDQCEHSAQSGEFEIEAEPDRYYCSNCAVEFDSSELLIEQRHVCNECDESFVTPSHRLWCRSCLGLCAPEESTERTLYEYTLSDHGELWFDGQEATRNLLQEELDSRGFDVETDVLLPEESTDPRPVHIYAVDDLLNQQFVVDVHSRIDASDVHAISTVAERIEAKPVLMTTDTTVSEEVSTVASQNGVLLLWVDRDDSIKRIAEENPTGSPDTPIMERLTSIFNRSPS